METTINLTKNSWVKLQQNVVSCTPEEFDELWATHPTEPQYVRMYGKMVKIPRHQRLYGEASYSFSGITLTPKATIPALVQKCLDFAKGEFNGALVNFYPDGDSYISQHSDDERDLVPGSSIYSFSFGATRTFQLKPKTKSGKAFSLKLLHGSCCIMGGACKRNIPMEFLKPLRKRELLEDVSTLP
jgi:alpha-ketoglutarate-dependent dioxygenase alkB family protein 2